MSLNARARTWWTPGLPLAVGGPSQKTQRSAPSRLRSDSAKTSRSRQRSRTPSSSFGKDWFESTGRRAMSRPGYALAPAGPGGEVSADVCQHALLALVEHRERVGD